MKINALSSALAVMTAIGCSANVKVEPVEVKPIKMTIDINVKVDRQLDDFFDFEEKQGAGIEGEARNEGDES